MKKYNIIYASIITVLTALLAFSCAKDGESYQPDMSGDGQGGSMARFTVYNDYIYTVDHRDLKITRITDPAKPQFLKKVTLDWGGDIETIFCMEQKLFIGSRSAMYIYDIERPEFPKRLSQTSHFTSCDPVVAYGDYAYVTLNSGNRMCGRGTNDLIVYDISNLYDPTEIDSYAHMMTSPKGLGVDGDASKLFVCDDGLKVFDITNPYNLVWIDDLTNVEEAHDIGDTYDVIPRGGLLMVVSSNGLYQFDYTEERLDFVSKIIINLDRE